MIEIHKSRSLTGFPEEQGLYNPKNEKDACGFGFIANIDNIAKHEIIHQALEIVHNLDHRGAVGADPLAGDGAGILIQIPNEFFSSELQKNKIILPSIEKYAVGMIFFPKDKDKRQKLINLIEKSNFIETQISLRSFAKEKNCRSECLIKNAMLYF